MKRAVIIFIITLCSYEIFAQADSLNIHDTRSAGTSPADYSRMLKAHFKYSNVLGLPWGGSSYHTVIGLRGWSDNTGGKAHELAFSDDGRFFFRSGYTPNWEGWRQILVSSENGNYGIGTFTPIGKFDVRGNAFIGTTDLVLGSTGSFVQIDQGAIAGDTFTQIRAFSGGGNAVNDLILQNTGGNVGIGTANPKGYRLAVAGNMIAESVKVSLQNNWPDYVFAKDYQLPTLQETEKHIKDKGHLQGIPSAAEVKANGIDLGEMNAKLLQKIEELTLHLIEQNKMLKTQQNALKVQQQEINALKSNRK
ncbi:hypothetical protein [Pedobacter africanus]|uniref:Uncharacterized protein n=1 Tax=Pedobacter africanus TaxID=151894 RepID=A0A1W2BRN2_9SPHI|nr:hypothetical protein [Pedobacter africanus]SMC75262.1 hypothetical protein SAMN04488524_2564 [Pedobacter africanus]